jgi:hypothetical protein
LVVVLNVPLSQAAQVWSARALPGLANCCPGAHAVKAVQAGALVCVLNMPCGQAAQLRSTVAVPSLDTNCPAPHVVLVAHKVAGSPS